MSSRSRRFSSYLTFLLILTLSVWVSSEGFAQNSKSFELHDGDRVVFVGNTFVERAIDYGHIELALTAQWSERNITFRNLGWSGDDARGRARRFFGPIEEGFKHLKTHVEGLNPTVIFVSYGAMESFEGRKGLSDFEANMNTLLDTLEETRARIVLLSPVPQENLGPPLPDPSENNANLRLYTGSIQTLAAKRNHWFINLFEHMSEAMKQSSVPMTDNGVHLNSLGYREAAQGILAGMGLAAESRMARVDGQGMILSATGVEVPRVQQVGDGLLITLQDPKVGDKDPVVLSIPRLFAGTYAIRLNGRNLGTFSSGELAAGVRLPWSPTVDQAALLRNTIITKNEFYFHKWRPQNETYLRGFRKHEQGQNVTELEEFDAFIEKEEVKIKDLKQPRFYTLQLQRVMER